MSIEQWSLADTAVTHDLYALVRALQLTDDPAGPPLSEHRARMWLANPAHPAEVWFARDDAAGAVAGFYRVEFPQEENRDRAAVLLCVHPEHRRRGTGTALLQHMAERAAANDRTFLSTLVWQGTPGEEYARHAGATAGLVDARRVLHVGERTYARAAALHETAAQSASGYGLVSWSGPAPDEYMDRVASLHNAMNDAPRDEGVEEARWDPDRVRRQIYGLLTALGGRFHEVAAIHDATGEMAALTMVELDQEIPEWGNQGITAVTRQHRGHRLGMLVKTAMLAILATAEPELKHILTGNAAVNDHMISINETLGFEMLEPQLQRYDLTVEAASRK